MPILAGQILRASYVNSTIAAATANLPLGKLAHTLQGTDQLIANSSSDFDSTGVAFSTAANRMIKTTFSCVITSTIAMDTVMLKLWDVDNNVQLNRTRGTVETAFADVPAEFTTYTTPTAGSHTYRIKVSLPFGTGPGGFRLGALLIVEDVGHT